MADRKKITNLVRDRAIADLARNATKAAPAESPLPAAQIGNAAAVRPEEPARVDRPRDFRVLPLTLLDASNLNTRFEIGDIETLAISIKTHGLMHNLVVRPKPDGRYEIISGHRRVEACKLLVQQGNTDYEKVPCNIKYTIEDDIPAELALIDANLQTRELSSIQRAEIAGRIAELRGEIPDSAGRKTRDIVAEVMEISPRSAQTLLNIDRKLIPELKDALTTSGINLRNAEALAMLSEEDQREIMAALTTKQEAAPAAAPAIPDANAEIKELIAQKQKAEDALQAEKRRAEKLADDLRRSKDTQEELSNALSAEKGKKGQDVNIAAMQAHIINLCAAADGIRQLHRQGARYTSVGTEYEDRLIKAYQDLKEIIG